VKKNQDRGSTKLCGGGWEALLVLLVSFPLLVSCSDGEALNRVNTSGKINLLTRNNAHCYYTYRERPMGFEYDLAKAFAQHLGVELQVATPTWEGLFQNLQEGRGDFIAASLTITPSRENVVDFSTVYLTIQQQVIVHKDNHRLQGKEDLAGETVHVRKGTSYEERLRDLQKEGVDVVIQLHEDTPTEELIAMVARKEIGITIADSHIALLNRRYYPSVKIAFPIAEPQYLAWAVKKGERGLLREINSFFRTIKRNGAFSDIYERYFAHVEIFDYVDLRRFHQRIRSRLPRYKPIIQEAAAENGFDWRLIAAMVYQESHFDPAAKSHTGVEGIMQLTEDTSQEMGIEDRTDPEQSITAGVRYLRSLYSRFDGTNGRDRLLLSLASYNVGRGHVLDAQKIAGELGLDPNSWNAVRRVLPLLRYPKYYRTSQYGYCRGTEPVRYVKRVLTYYDILKRDAISQRDEPVTVQERG
jgi:membrane-bound lytic murein transglycosylase F